jgi:hypothetical protein
LICSIIIFDAARIILCCFRLKSDLVTSKYLKVGGSGYGKVAESAEPIKTVEPQTAPVESKPVEQPHSVAGHFFAVPYPFVYPPPVTSGQPMAFPMMFATPASTSAASPSTEVNPVESVAPTPTQSSVVPPAVAVPAVEVAPQSAPPAVASVTQKVVASKKEAAVVSKADKEKLVKQKARPKSAGDLPKPIYLKNVQSKLKARLDEDRRSFLQRVNERKELITGTATCEYVSVILNQIFNVHSFVDQNIFERVAAVWLQPRCDRTLRLHLLHLRRRCLLIGCPHCHLPIPSSLLVFRLNRCVPSVPNKICSVNERLFWVEMVPQRSPSLRRSCEVPWFPHSVSAMLAMPSMCASESRRMIKCAITIL